jgi:hypothetical protein
MGTSGSIRVTADTALGGGVNGAIRVYSATWLCDGTIRNLVLKNGTTASGDIFVQKAGVAGLTVTQNFENGLRFPDGCFIDYTANTVSVVLEYVKEA